MSRAAVERVLVKTRNDSRNQTLSAMFGTTMIALFMGSPTLTAIFLGLNALALFFLGRRWLRLRPGGPVARALLEAPEQIASIHQWPPKLPPNRQPVGLDIKTKDGAEGILILDPKDPNSHAVIVETLRARSPEAVVVYTGTPHKLA